MLKPALFSEGSDLGQSINGIFELIKEYSTIKEGNIAGALDDNPRWIGSMGVLSDFWLDPQRFGPIFGNGIIDHAGGKPWTFGFRNCHPRKGPLSTPVAGMPALVKGCDNMYACLFPVKPLLDTGITLQTFDQYVNRPGGKQFLDEHAICASLGDNDYLFIPGGWVCHFTAFEEVQKRATPNLSFAVHLPLAGAFISASMEGPVKTAIFEWSEEVLRQKESNGMWKRRAEYFRQVMG